MVLQKQNESGNFKLKTLLSHRGFTLIELLVVISIIALLLSILMPSLSKVKEQARKTICMSNMRQVGIATIAYMGDNNDKLWHNASYGTAGGAGSGAMNGWLNHILYYPIANPDNVTWSNHGLLYGYNYISDPMVYYCPSNKQLPIQKGLPYYVKVAYDDYWTGGSLKEETQRLSSIVYSNYISRSFTMWGKSYRMSQFSADKISPDEAILADMWVCAGPAVHEKKHIAVMYADTHTEIYDDTDQVVAALGTCGKPGFNTKIDYNTALNTARQDHGSIAMDLWWATGWLYLDKN